MVYPKIALAQSIIEICLAKGITNIIISPGSRNAPLIIGFVNNPEFNCYSIADERCAAFFALGIAQQTHKPAVVVCTSGSALLNYYPAFAEAFYSQIPLIVISADRPSNKIDIGDGQTIRQKNVFANHSLYNANLTEEASEENDFKINEAINKAFNNEGPVHINAPFEEPLYQTVSELEVDVTISVFDKVYKELLVDDIIVYSNIWNTSKKKLILVGECHPNEIDLDSIEQIANDNSVVVMTETTSNLHHKSFLANIDAVITPFTAEDFEDFQPDLLITFGGMVVSKRIKAFLRKYQPKHHWHIDTHRAYDTFGCLTSHIDSDPNVFFNQILPFTNAIESDYRQKYQEIKAIRKLKHQEI